MPQKSELHERSTVIPGKNTTAGTLHHCSGAA